MAISCGWRPLQTDEIPVTFSPLFEHYNVHGVFHIVWSVDILKEEGKNVQVLKIWDVVKESEIPKLRKNLEFLYGNYTMDTISRCKCRCVETYGYATFFP